MKRKDQQDPGFEDPVTQRLVEGGVFSVRGHGEGRSAGSGSSYSILSGIKYTFLLSLFLWWFPLVGNMVAGYVGGRRSGSGWKGVVAAIFPLIVIWSFFFCRDHGLLPTLVTTIISIPGMIDSAILNDLPMIAPYYQAGVLYVNAFLVFLHSILQYQVNLYLVTIVFAYLGGAVSEMKQREMERYGSSSSAHVTLNLFHRGKDRDEEDTPSSRRIEEDDVPRVHMRRGSIPEKKKDIVPLGLRSYPNWRRRRIPGERGREGRVSVQKRGDPLKKLDEEGIPLSAGESVSTRGQKRRTPINEEEEDTADQESKDEERVRLSAIDRAISRYMEGSQNTTRPVTPSPEKNWDVL